MKLNSNFKFNVQLTNYFSIPDRLKLFDPENMSHPDHFDKLTVTILDSELFDAESDLENLLENSDSCHCRNHRKRPEIEF